MFYNIEIRKMRKRQGEREGGSTPYYIYTRARGAKGDTRMGSFLPTGKKVFPNGGEIIQREGRKLKKSRGNIEK
jgi:hypothetical protein